MIRALPGAAGVSGLYLGALVVSLASMVAIDRRWRLFLSADARRGAIVLLAGIVVLLSWDAAAIRLGFFERGHGQALVGVEIAPHLPVEELFFVAFLSYLAMVGHALARRLLDRRDAELEAARDAERRTGLEPAHGAHREVPR